METINNVAATAAKVVWGSGDAHKDEPVSGVNGDVAKGEPYDAGNLAPEDQKKVESRLSGEEGGPTDKKDSSKGADDSTPAQVDTRDPDDVETPANPTGPGPRPLADVAREHGGDAGHDTPAEAEADVDAKPKPEADPQQDSASKGTGEQVVKTTGLAADGGNFDATKPGAGIEADRLMDQKGIHPNAAAPTSGDKATADSETSSPKTDKSKNRLSLSQRIKAKFHKR